jgi:hypothetical protein
MIPLRNISRSHIVLDRYSIPIDFLLQQFKRLLRLMLVVNPFDRRFETERNQQANGDRRNVN